MKLFYFIYFLSTLISGWGYGKTLEIRGESPALFWEASVQVEREKVYLLTQYTAGDGVTSFSCRKTLLPISSDNIRMITNDESWLIVANDDYYYYIREYNNVKEAKVIPLLPTQEVKEVLEGGHVYFTQGAWYRLDYKLSSEDHKSVEITKEALTDFPTQEVVVLQSSERKTLLKDAHKVYVYREEQYSDESSIKVVAGLDAPKVYWVVGGYGSYDYLYDEDTFYITKYDSPWLWDYTERFTCKGFTQKFTEGILVLYGQKTYYRSAFWDFHEGRLWFCEYFDGGPQIVPREDITYEKSLDLLQKEGMYYRDYSHYRNRDRDDDYYRPIDPSAVKNPKQLRIIKAPKDSYLAEDPFYYDGLFFYTIYKNRFFPIKTSPLQEKILLANERYHTTGQEFVLIDGKMVFYYVGRLEIKENEHLPICPIKITQELPFTSPLRDIGVGYVTKDWLVLGRYCIRNTTDYQSLSFVRATMDMNLYLSYKKAPTYYYFKDKNRSYRYIYTERKKKLQQARLPECR
ncbi:hypothetical protein [Capnocytophaga gingivalis]